MYLGRIAILGALGFAITLPTASAQSVGAPLAVSADAGYLLGINDQIEITIFGAGQSQAVRSRITEDGTVVVPYLGAVKATGMTARQLSEELTRILKSRGIFNNPVVGVEVLQFVSNTVTVFGEVGNAGLYPLDQPLTIARLMAKAGGTRGGAADFVILRRSGTEHRVLLSSGSGEWSSSTAILPGDELYVPTAPTIYIYGQVNSAGSYSIKSNMTVLQALARAGGPTLGGSQNKISLYRDGKKIKRIKLDGDVRDGDVLYVHERLF